MHVHKINEILKEDSYKIWEKSNNSNIFNNPNFLSFYNDVKFYGAYKGEELICCWPVITKDDSFEVPDFFYYLGPFWSNKFDEKKIHSRFSLSIDIYNCYIDFFIKKFKKFQFQFHFSLKDIRAFDWYNFDKSENEKFIIKNKYTAIIKDLKIKDEKKLLSEYRYVRRYEIKNFNKYKDNIIKSDINIDQAIELYFETSGKIDSKNFDDKKKNIIKLINLAKKGFGEIFSFKEKKTNKPISFTLLLFDKKNVNLVINCSDKEWKKNGFMAWNLNEKLKLYLKKYDTFDFNGANSPKRGDDKHSYGAEEKLFFEVAYKL